MALKLSCWRANTEKMTFSECCLYRQSSSATKMTHMQDFDCSRSSVQYITADTYNIHINYVGCVVMVVGYYFVVTRMYSDTVTYQLLVI